MPLDGRKLNTMERQFKGIWIPAKIWLDKSLTPIEKILLADIDSFTGNGKDFYKTNITLSMELHCSEATIKRAVKRLRELNHVSIKHRSRNRLIRSLLDSAHNDLNVAQFENNKVQDDLPPRSKCTTTNTDTSTSIKPTTKGDLIMPFTDVKFTDAWDAWKSERSARRYGKYTPVGEQTALHKLFIDSNEDLETAIAIIHQSIANSWRGLFSLKNGKATTTKKFDTDEYRSYIESL